MDNKDFWFITGGVIVLILLVTGCIIWLGVQASARTDALMAQCLQDGRKEYECYNLIEKHDTVPVFIPTR